MNRGLRGGVKDDVMKQSDKSWCESNNNIGKVIRHFFIYISMSVCLEQERRDPSVYVFVCVDDVLTEGYTLVSLLRISSHLLLPSISPCSLWPSTSADFAVDCRLRPSSLGYTRTHAVLECL